VTLADLLAGLDGVDASGDLGTGVTGIGYDSRSAAPGQLFFALPGLRNDGAQFVADALSRGVAAVVTAATVTVATGGRPHVRAVDPRLTLAQVACRFHGAPSRRMRVVAVTGTNGKTTTTFMLEAIFRAAGWSAGVIGTTGVRLDGETRPSAFTTPEAPELQALLAEMAGRGVRAVALEASSHALVQRRTWGLECDACVFTNLTQDHLDYHGTMDAYLDAKLMLFDGRNGRTDKPAVAVVNADDPAAPRVAAAAATGGQRVVHYGAGAADVTIASVRPVAAGLELQLQVTAPGARAAAAHAVTLPMLGRYNAWNAAAAYAAALALGVEGAAIARGLESMPGVPGRLERVDAGQPFAVVVDYAHTPDALERALAACREHSGGRVLLVFGCGGDRDRAKRPLMGAIAARLADRVWVTNDNPRTEQPEAIAREIASGMPAAPAIVLDRREAIAAAFGVALPGDVVLVAGKGHETTQTIGDRVLPFDDREVARALLRDRRTEDA